MRCKKHTVDSSSSIGVCASCLRERLFSLAASEDSLASSDGGGSSSSERIFQTERSFKKKQNGLSRLFRTRSNDFSDTSTSWLSKVLSKKDNTTCYIEDLIVSESKPRQRYCKGMSPAKGVESVEESPGRARRTGTPGRRNTVATMALCLSPLVRAKPNCSSNRKGKFPPDFGYTGEIKSPVKPHISTAASFYANRSKKLVDLGRVDHRR